MSDLIPHLATGIGGAFHGVLDSGLAATRVRKLIQSGA